MRNKEKTLFIFEGAKTEDINRRCPEVAVLSAFPLYVLDYYGWSRIVEKLNVAM